MQSLVSLLMQMFKRKVFDAEIQPEWKSALKKVKKLFETIKNSHEIPFKTYISLHKKEQKASV